MTKLTVATGPHLRKNRRFHNHTFDNWEEFAVFVGEPKEGEKDGLCFLQGSLKGIEPKQKPNDKTSYSNRYLENVEKQSVMGFDVDSGQAPEPIIETLKERGLAFVAYSSHSDTPEYRKARFVIKLAKPFEIGDDLKHAKLTWKRLYLGIAHELGIDIDKACLDLTRLFFTARYPEGRDPKTRLFKYSDGKGLDLDPYIRQANDRDFDQHLPKPPPSEKLHQHRERSPGEQVFIEGIDLVRWVGLTEGKFNLNEVVLLNDMGDVLSEDDEKSEVVCPFDDHHESAPGERTSGFFVSDPNKEHPSFGTHCCHASCAGRDRLDYLRGLIERGDVIIEFLKDPQFYQDGEDWDAEKKAQVEDCLDGFAPLPSGFSYDPDTQRVLKQSQDEKKGPYPICGMLKAKATIHNEDDDGYGTLVVIRTRQGLDKEVVLEASLKPADAATRLRDKGLQVFASPGAEQAFKELIAALNPKRVIIEATRPSFHDGGKIFISPLGTVIRADGHDQSEWRLNDDIRLKAEPKGTLEDWSEKVAIPSFSDSDHLPHFGVGILAGFVGPIIHWLDIDTCMLNFSGPTSKGKTSSLKLQASVWGPTRGKESLRFEARGTANAMEALIEKGNGISVGLDELAHAQQVGKLIFAIASGQGNNRMHTSGSGLRNTRRWNTFVLMSGEKSVRAYVEADNQQFLGGMGTRCADVSVADLENHPDPAFIDQILKDAEKFNGTAGPSFVEHVMRNEDIDLINKRINELKLELTGDGASGAEQRAVIPFVLLAVAGEIAKRARVLPKEIDHMSSINWACNQAQASSVIEALDTVQESINAINEFVSSNMGGSIVKMKDGLVVGTNPMQGATGWYDPSKGIVYFLWSELEKTCVTDARAVAKELLKRGLIEPRLKGEGRIDPYHTTLPGSLPDVKHIRLKLEGDVMEENDPAIPPHLPKDPKRPRQFTRH